MAMVALACIWFSDAVASLAGLHHWRMHPPANGPMSGCFFAFAGWMLLKLPLLAFFWL
ncbi:MAG: hypothetical protein WD066_02815 [Planctomycetaceae bacterium]